MHALHFKRLATETCASETASATSMFSVEPCGTGTEIDRKTGKLLDASCINEVFAMVQQDKLPGTALLFDFVAHTFFAMSKKDEPWAKKFAFVVAAGTAIMRQMMQPVYMEEFNAAYNKIIAANSYRPTAPYTLRYQKSTIFSIFFAKVVDQITEFVASPCSLIPQVGMSFIASIQFPLGSWCKYGISGVVKKIIKLMEPTVVKLAVKISEKTQKTRQGQGQKNTLRCFNMKTVAKLLVSRIDKMFTQFNGDPCDFFKPLDPKDPTSTIFNKEGFTDKDLLAKFDTCKDRKTFVNDETYEPPEPQKVDDDSKSEFEDDVKADKDKEDETQKYLAKKKLPKEDKSECENVVKGFLGAQLPPHIKASETIKYALLTLIDNVFNYLEDKVQVRVSKFVHFVNVATGAADPIKAGMCCSLDDGAKAKKAKKCCRIDTESQCDSQNHCIWYQIKPDHKYWKDIIAAYPDTQKDPKKPKRFRLACAKKYAGQKVRAEPAEGSCPAIDVWTREAWDPKKRQKKGYLARMYSR